MKKSNLILIMIGSAVIALIAVIFANTTEPDQGFADAEKHLGSGLKNETQIVGTLKKDSEGNVEGIQYDPATSPDYYSFLLVDNKGRAERVHYYDGKPPMEFEKVTSVTVRGYFESKDKFKATKIIPKCPSKYQDEGQVSK